MAACCYSADIKGFGTLCKREAMACKYRAALTIGIFIERTNAKITIEIDALNLGIIGYLVALGFINILAEYNIINLLALIEIGIEDNLVFALLYKAGNIHLAEGFINLIADINKLGFLAVNRKLKLRGGFGQEI